jgi:hypothetical protein
MAHLLIDYHQAFHSAIQKFSSVVENITESQAKTHQMRDHLDDTKLWLSNKSYNLMHLWLKNAQLSEMCRVLDQMYWLCYIYYRDLLLIKQGSIHGST